MCSGRIFYKRYIQVRRLRMDGDCGRDLEGVPLIRYLSDKKAQVASVLPDNDIGLFKDCIGVRQQDPKHRNRPPHGDFICIVNVRKVRRYAHTRMA